jgi:hypothetical protein
MKTHKHTTRPLNNLTIPLGVQREVIQYECNVLLERDPLFHNSYRQLRDNYTSGTIAANVFKNILRWNVAACLRRAGLPLRTARMYQALSIAA